MRGSSGIGPLVVVVLAAGCILEDNPSFMDTQTSGASATGGSESSAMDTRASVDSTAATLTDPTADSTETTGDKPPQTGCDDPEACTTYHIGPVEDSCPHEVDGAESSACDFVDTDALLMAVDALAGRGEGGLIIMHDHVDGSAASYKGSLDVPGSTTLRAAWGVLPQAVRVFLQGPTQGVLRLHDDGVHLQGFTVICRTGGQWGLTTRLDLESSGTETSHHLIEALVLAATRPENVGINSTDSAIQSLGPDTTVRNTHIWGYFEGSIDMRFATRSVFSHNTVLLYQPAGPEPTIDARLVKGVEISNNVFASLSGPAAALVEADGDTIALLVVGNAIEGYVDTLAGLDRRSPEVTLMANSLDPLELESPYRPLPLADSTLRASTMGVAGGTSLDGVPVVEGERYPGAYQQASALSLPRRAVITVGENGCGGRPCTITTRVDNELQRAVWSAWPGAAVELHPSVTPYAGPVVISWPIELRGSSADPTQAVIRSEIEDSTLGADGVWSGKQAVVDLTGDMGQPSVVERLTIEAGPEEVGLYHEGQTEATLTMGRHEVRRVILHDAEIVAGPPADIALYLGNEVSAHDVLVHGGYDTCVRFGPRPSESGQTLATTAYVHHLTCRLTLDSPGAPVAAFEIAGAQDVVIADAVIELAQDGPLFRAQRRSVGDDGPTALDVPASFTAQAISARGFGLQFDGFSDVDGVYTVVDVDTVGAMEPLFVSESDSRLEVGALGIDGGVDPATLEPGLSLGIDLDGIDRSGLAVDRGAYEQGQ